MDSFPGNEIVGVQERPGQADQRRAVGRRNGCRQLRSNQLRGGIRIVGKRGPLAGDECAQQFPLGGRRLAAQGQERRTADAGVQKLLRVRQVAAVPLAVREGASGTAGTSFVSRSASPWASSTKAASLATVSDCSGVFERGRRVQAV